MRCYSHLSFTSRARWALPFVLTMIVAHLAFVAQPARAQDGLCKGKDECKRADAVGRPMENGKYLARCAGRFPDFLVPRANIPKNYDGPSFSLAQDYPAEPPAGGDLPWADIDFKASDAEADKYLYALRDYAFEGMIEAGFVPAKNPKRAWYHVPLMNFHNGREFVHGLTKERPLSPGELGLKNEVENYAIGFYNDIGAYTIGQIWKETNNPDVLASKFKEGTMVFKILFSTARPEDFENPESYILEDAPQWMVAVGPQWMFGVGPEKLTPVRLLQMDVAVRDDRAEKTGWVFGTLAFDKDADDPVTWNRMRPVGLMWGDDPGYTPENQKAGDSLKESFISDEIPAYAKDHLGWAGRVNGPVDNPSSSCMSCHGTAQYPVSASMLPDSSCKSDDQKLHWFRNISPDTPFGGVDRKNCKPTEGPEKFLTLDFSLQVQVALQSLLDYNNVNTCSPALSAAKVAVGRGAPPLMPRIER